MKQPRIFIKDRSFKGLIKILQPHGNRERSRRKHQIAKGQLKKENGLICPQMIN